MSSDTLFVYLHDTHIGNLVPMRNMARFQFLDEISQQKIGSPFFSTALIVQNNAFDALKTANWFSGLLPEDARLDAISRFFGVNEGDYLAVLGEVGWECAVYGKVLHTQKTFIPKLQPGMKPERSLACRNATKYSKLSKEEN